MSLRSELFEAVRAALFESGITQKALSRSMGVNQSELSKIKRGHDALSIEKLIAIGGALGVGITWQLGKCEPAPITSGSDGQDRFARSLRADDGFFGGGQ
jgi:transcriptional regulator with XRE-family HTH domain